MESVSTQSAPGIRGTFDRAHSVLSGEIGPFPIGPPFNKSDLSLNVTYIKMAIDEKFEEWDRLQSTERAALDAKYGSEVPS